MGGVRVILSGIAVDEVTFRGHSDSLEREGLGPSRRLRVDGAVPNLRLIPRLLSHDGLSVHSAPVPQTRIRISMNLDSRSGSRAWAVIPHRPNPRLPISTRLKSRWRSRRFVLGRPLRMVFLELALEVEDWCLVLRDCSEGRGEGSSQTFASTEVPGGGQEERGAEVVRGEDGGGEGRRGGWVFFACFWMYFLLRDGLGRRYVLSWDINMVC